MNEPVINPNGHNISTQSTSTLKDLVFNPETGDFEQVDRGTANEGDTVTKMTEDGFALFLSDGFCHASNENEPPAESDSKIGSSCYKSLVYNPETDEFEFVERANDEDKTNFFID